MMKTIKNNFGDEDEIKKKKGRKNTSALWEMEMGKPASANHAPAKGRAQRTKAGELEQGETLEILPIESIKENPLQIRKHYDADKISTIAMSIKNGGTENDPLKGQVTPISVVPAEDGNGYLLVAGGYRINAIKMLQKSDPKRYTHVKAVVKRNYTKDDLIMETIKENRDRTNLHPVEIALWTRKVIAEELFTDRKQIALLFNKTEADISRINGLLKLPDDLINELGKHEITDMHSVDMIRKIKDEKVQRDIFDWYFGHPAKKRPSRKEVKAKIDKLLPEKVTEKYSIKAGKHGITVTLPELSGEQIKKIEVFIKTLMGD